ncbi:ferric reductase like transmembrane component [Diplodia corticola]|uniref:ferric-chelate reductase (NADPH) n=1 Tax=Diplodia corticola TaxID=236234 RepID=A0A1J9QUS9_9PEZI|nr:ferric reductase like transmembrane component [Diplodia corticola]OJD32153.1 ferric reductase like transmembrane component [Diplodia corticola]
MLSASLTPLLLSAMVARAAAEEAKSPSAIAAMMEAIKENINVSYWLGWTWLACTAALMVYLIGITFTRYVRGIACLNNPHQRYFAEPNWWYARFKCYLFDAPLLRTRHHREYKLSSAINIGTLPSRLQTIYLVGYCGMNVAFSVIFIDWSDSGAASELRNRTGVLCVMNMLPLFLLAGRNNPLIKITGITFDTFNLVHRWVGRIVILQAVAHTLAWMIPKVQAGGWAAVAGAMGHSQFILWGTIGTLCFVVIMFQAAGPVRHAFYEVFLHFHVLLAALGLAGVWIHCQSGELYQFPIIKAVLALWVFERFARLFWVIFRNVGNGGTKAEIESLPGDCLRINLQIARPWKFKTGQHVYLYMPSIGWWTSHPFSLSWSEEQEAWSEEKGMSLERLDLSGLGKTTMSLLVRRRTGFTDALYKKVEQCPSGKLTTSALVEGPYGHQDLSSYGTVMLFAAGIGITHQVPHVRHLVEAYDKRTAAVRRVTLVWVIQSPEHLEWIRPWMTEILSMPNRRDVLKILLFVTRPRSTKEIHSPSSSVQMFPGKPNIQALVDQEMMEGVGACGISVCGTGSLADDVRRAARNRQTRWNVDFFEEAFSW